MYCSNCGNKIGDSDRFCSKCGNVVKAPVQQKQSSVTPEPQNEVNNYSRGTNGVTENQQGAGTQPNRNPNLVIDLNGAANFVTDKANTVKNKVNGLNPQQKKLIPIVAASVVAVVVLLVLLLNIHTCDDCGDVFFGAKNEVSVWGEDYCFCDDCYDGWWY